VVVGVEFAQNQHHVNLVTAGLPRCLGHPKALRNFSFPSDLHFLYETEIKMRGKSNGKPGVLQGGF
jgi:hypothetical protein